MRNQALVLPRRSFVLLALASCMPRSGRGSPGDEAGPEGGPVEPTEPARAAAPAPAEPEVGGPPSDPVVPDGDPPPHVEHVEVDATHAGLGIAPEVLRILAERLAAPASVQPLVLARSGAYPSGACIE